MTHSTTLNNLRVVVFLKEENFENDDAGFQFAGFTYGFKYGLKRKRKGRLFSSTQALRSNGERDITTAKIFCLDDKSLKINLTSAYESNSTFMVTFKMNFDRIARCTADAMNWELPLVADDLLLKRKDSCIIRVAAPPETDTVEFYEFLLTFLSVTISHKKHKLQNITLDYHHIAASGQNSKNQPCRRNSGVSGHSRGASTNASHNQEHILRSLPKRLCFHSTADFLLRFSNEYRNKFCRHGHQKIKFSLNILDQQKNLFKVTLSILNIYFNRMNTEDRYNWHNYMNIIGEGRKVSDDHFTHSDLAMNWSNYIEGATNENILLLFDVPTVIEMRPSAVEMLQIAYSVIRNREKRFLQTRKLSVTQLRNKVVTNCDKLLISPLKVDINRNIITASFCNTNNSNKYFNSLHSWYRKIDECFQLNYQSSERYYTCYFKSKMKKLLAYIENMFNLKESLQTEKNINDLNKIHKDKAELYKLFEKHSNARMQFQKIFDDIENSEFEYFLNLYMKTKAKNLHNQVFDLKQKYLKLCQNYLNVSLHKLSKTLLMETKDLSCNYQSLKK